MRTAVQFGAVPIHMVFPGQRMRTRVLDLLTVGVFALGLVVFLSRGRSADLPPSLAVGDPLPRILASLPSGERFEVPEDGADLSVILVYSPTCGTCQMQVHGWRELADEFSRRGVRFAAVTDHLGGGSFLAREDVQDGVVRGADLFGWGISVVPTTLVVASDHSVLFKHTGLMTDSTEHELRDVLGGTPGAIEDLKSQGGQYDE